MDHSKKADKKTVVEVHNQNGPHSSADSTAKKREKFRRQRSNKLQTLEDDEEEIEVASKDILKEFVDQSFERARQEVQDDNAAASARDVLKEFVDQSFERANEKSNVRRAQAQSRLYF